MKKIVIIGAGELGSRHLQGLCKMEGEISIDVVDPNNLSLEIAEQRANEVLTGSNRGKIKYYNSIDFLTNEIDICIVATTASLRYRILVELLGKKKVKNLILEKILFQKIEEYNKIQKLVNQNGINCWVNCPRRFMPVYQNIKKLIQKDEKVIFTVIGGDWGLACNSIHFIDTLAYLNDNEDFQYNTAGILKIVNGKREGYLELLGTLFGKQSNNSELFLHSRENSTAPIRIQILAENYSWQIDEGNGVLITSNKDENWKPVKTNFEILYQSQMSNLIAERILKGENVGLTEYSVSNKLHQDMITAMLPIFSKHMGENIDHCPIT